MDLDRMNKNLFFIFLVIFIDGIHLTSVGYDCEDAPNEAPFICSCDLMTPYVDDLVIISK